MGVRRTISEYQQTVQLKKEGLGNRRISKRLNIPRATVLTWLAKPPKYVTKEARKKYWWQRHSPNYTEEEKRLIALGIDFEGCIGLYRWSKQTGHFRPIIAIASTSKELIDYWLRLVRIGSVTSQIYNSRRNKHWKDAYYWRMTAAGEVLSLLKQVVPYLIAKHRQAQLVILALERRISLEVACAEMHILNAKGKKTK